MKNENCVLAIIAEMRIDTDNFYYAVNTKQSIRTQNMITDSYIRKLRRIKKFHFKNAVIEAGERYFNNN